ncbi:hypothetical protein OAN61_00665 [bacterium]|nr:hypothetical protein [bacterium]
MQKLREEVDNLKAEHSQLLATKKQRDAEIKEFREKSKLACDAGKKDAELAELFDRVDSDDSGKIGSEELLAALTEMDPKGGHTLADVEVMIKDLEADSEGLDDGQLEFEEFKEILAKLGGGGADGLSQLGGYAKKMKALLKEQKHCNDELNRLEEAHAELTAAESKRKKWARLRDDKMQEINENRMDLQREDETQAHLGGQLEEAKQELRNLELGIAQQKKEGVRMGGELDKCKRDLEASTKAQRKSLDKMGQRHNAKTANDEMESDLRSLMESLNEKFAKMQELLNDPKADADVWLKPYASKGTEYLYSKSARAVEVDDEVLAEFDETLKEFEGSFNELQQEKKRVKGEMSEVNKQFDQHHGANQTLEVQIQNLVKLQEQADERTAALRKQQADTKLAYEKVKQAVRLREAEIEQADKLERWKLRRLLRTVEFRTQMREKEAAQTVKIVQHGRGIKEQQLRGLWDEVDKQERAIVARFREAAQNLGRDYEESAAEIRAEVCPAACIQLRHRCLPVPCNSSTC